MPRSGLASATLACALALSPAALADDDDDQRVDLEPSRGFEVGVLTGPAFDDRFVTSMSTSVVARYFASDSFAAGLEGIFLKALDSDTELERWENDRLGFAAQFSWVAFHDRFGRDPEPGIDLYLVGAIGMVSSEPVPQVESRAVQVAIAALAGGGIGTRITLTSWLATALEVRNDFFLGGETRSVTSGRLGLTVVMPAR